LNRCPGASGRAVSIEISIYVMRVTRGINYRNERDMEVDTPKNAAAFKVVVNHEEQCAIWPDE
jgi:hypothetical protein